MSTQILVWIGIVVLVVIAGLVVIYQFFPATLLAMMQGSAARRSKLTKKTIGVDGVSAHYYEGGNPEGDTLVLLHGLGDEKNSFVTSVPELVKTYRIILPDLAAHGENAQIAGKDYSIYGQVNFIVALMNAIGMNKAVFGGNSMGGHIAAALACRHPDRVNGLILINATGMQLGLDSVYLYYPEPVDVDYINEMFGRVFVKPPSIPKPIMQHMIDDLNPKVPFFNQLIADVENGTDFDLDEKVKSLDTPTLVLWGREDPVVPTQYAEAFHERIANSTLKIIENAGHSPQFEIPKIIQSEITQFLQGIN